MAVTRRIGGRSRGDGTAAWLTVKPQTFTFAAPPHEMVLENGQKLGPITLARAAETFAIP